MATVTWAFPPPRRRPTTAKLFGNVAFTSYFHICRTNSLLKCHPIVSHSIINRKKLFLLNAKASLQRVAFKRFSIARKAFVLKLLCVYVVHKFAVCAVVLHKKEIGMETVALMAIRNYLEDIKYAKQQHFNRKLPLTRVSALLQSKIYWYVSLQRAFLELTISFHISQFKGNRFKWIQFLRKNRKISEFRQ